MKRFVFVRDRVIFDILNMEGIFVVMQCAMQCNGIGRGLPTAASVPTLYVAVVVIDNNTYYDEYY